MVHYSSYTDYYEGGAKNPHMVYLDVAPCVLHEMPILCGHKEQRT